MRLAAAGLVSATIGLWAFVYAHSHEPTPQADPMAVHLLSPAGYDWLHYGGLALIVAGAFLLCRGVLVAIARERR